MPCLLACPISVPVHPKSSDDLSREYIEDEVEVSVSSGHRAAPLLNPGPATTWPPVAIYNNCNHFILDCDALAQGCVPYAR